MLNINGSTLLLGVMGDPISHTASPRMHNAAFEHVGVNAVYVPLHVVSGQVEFAIQALRVLQFKGVNVTVPHKEKVVAFLDEIDPLARMIGAVNTIVSINKRLVGFNTDAPGFLVALKEELRFLVAGKHVCILGAGGTAKALAVAMAHAGVGKLGIVNRTMASAQAIAAVVSGRCDVRSYALNSLEMRTFLSQCDLVINTTSVGMVLGESPVDDFAWVRPSQIVVDVIYNPVQTTFLQQASQRGATVLNGVGMLAAQGMLAFELFTGKTISYDFMKQHILRG